MRNFIQPGNIITLTAPAGGVASGDPVLIGSIFGVCAYDADADTAIEVQVVGVFDLPKAAEQFTQGVKVYWDATNSVVTITAGSNALIGTCVEAAGTSAATAKVRLNGVVV